MNLLALFSYVFAFWATALSQPITLYLAPDGADTNPGTQEAPHLSLTGARDLIRKLQAFDTVYVKIAPRDYQLTRPLQLTSADAAPIVFEGMNDRVTFYGGVSISGWEKVSDRLWRAPVPLPYHGRVGFE